MISVGSARWRTSFALAAAGFVLIAAGREVRGGSLRAGAAVEDITAEKPSTAVHDPLRAKALVLADGNTRAAIVCLDLGGASSSLVSNVRRRVQEELGMEGVNVLISTTHNHHTYGQVANDVAERIVEAIRKAAQTLAPVRIGVGVGREDRITINRRLRLSNGKHWTIRRATPSPPDCEVVGLGPVDDEIGILRLDRASGRPLAVLYNFAGHAYGGVPNGGVTADFPGFASEVLEEALGSGAVALFLQGAAGDVTPIRYKDVDAPPPTERLGAMLGLSTLKALDQIPMKEDGSLRILSETIELPGRQDLDARIASLETQQEEILQFFTGVGCGTHGAGTFLNFKSFLPLYIKRAVDPVHPSYSSYLYEHEKATGRNDLERLDEENKQRVEKYLECIRRMERLILIRLNLESLKRLRQQGAGGTVAAEIQGVKIGDFVLVTFPGEAFAEVALRIKEQSPFEHTFVAAYANGQVGYAPTADAYDKEAYEDCLTSLAPQWQAIYETKALEIIRRLGKAPP